MKRIQLVINNGVKKYREEFFIKGELKCILNLYAKMVSNGSWTVSYTHLRAHETV